MRLDRLRLSLLILAACSISLSLNFFFRSRLPPRVVNKVAGTRPEQEVKETVIGDRDVEAAHGSIATLQRVPAFSYNDKMSPQPTNTFDIRNTMMKAKGDLSPSLNEVEHDIHEMNGFNASLDGASPTSSVIQNETELVGSGVKWCPDIPPVLEGALAVMQQEVIPQELMAWYPDFESGGRIRPKDCVPRQRLAIIIPYRNRYPHLHIMINNLVPVLQRQQADVTFFVIEQALPETFNRGALLNIGFLEANKLGDFDCFIFHDVDLIPLNDHNLYRCGDNPRHFAVSMNKFGYQLLYKGYFGGVVGFTKKQYLTVNGCSNIYFGWGGEDDDLLYRLRHKNYTMVRYDAITAKYDMIKHKRDKGNEENPFRSILLSDAYRRQDTEGLNVTTYTVNSIRIERLYTWINVSLKLSDILQTAPEYTLNLIKGQINKMKSKSKQNRKRQQEQAKRQKRDAQFKAELSIVFSLVTPKSFRKFFVH